MTGVQTCALPIYADPAASVMLGGTCFFDETHGILSRPLGALAFFWPASLMLIKHGNFRCLVYPTHSIPSALSLVVLASDLPHLLSEVGDRFGVCPLPREAIYIRYISAARPTEQSGQTSKPESQVDHVKVFTHSDS